MKVYKREDSIDSTVEYKTDPNVMLSDRNKYYSPVMLFYSTSEDIEEYLINGGEIRTRVCANGETRDT